MLAYGDPACRPICLHWSVFFGSPGSLNDLNILGKSSIIRKILSGDLDLKIPDYKINGSNRDCMYFLMDAIYPSWAIFVKPFDLPIDDQQKEFNRWQELA
jgi:hypothetical protein